MAHSKHISSFLEWLLTGLRMELKSHLTLASLEIINIKRFLIDSCLAFWYISTHENDHKSSGMRNCFDLIVLISIVGQKPKGNLNNLWIDIRSRWYLSTKRLGECARSSQWLLLSVLGPWWICLRLMEIFSQLRHRLLRFLIDILLYYI